MEMDKNKTHTIPYKTISEKMLLTEEIKMIDYKLIDEICGKRILEKEAFSESCPLMGYKGIDLPAMKMYFWIPEYGLIAVINQHTQTPVVYKTTREIPDDFYEMKDLLGTPEFLKDCSEKHFNRTSDLENFLNHYMSLLTGQKQDT